MNDTRWQFSAVPDLLAHALAIEDEACARYLELADQMDTHNNSAAAFFRRIAKLEGLHTEKIRARCANHSLPLLAPWQYRWRDPEAPESTDYAVVDHMLTLVGALKLALHNEQRARDYFLAVAHSCTDSGVRGLAMELAEDEDRHMEWLARELQDAELQPVAPRTDPDPPTPQD